MALTVRTGHASPGDAIEARPHRGWSSWTLSRRLRVALLALCLLLLVTGAALVLVLRRADRALSAQSERTFPARLAASELLSSLVDQETGLRGYALSADEAFLAPYRQGLIDEQVARATLEDLVPQDDPARLALLTFDAAITAWRDQYASLRTDGRTTAEADSTIEFGRQLFERVRETGADLDAKLAREVDTAQRAADRDRAQVAIFLTVMAAAVVVGVIALQRALKSSVVRPLGDLASQIGVVSHGDHAAPIRASGPPDIRDMGDGVESMRLELLGAFEEVEEQRRGLERKAAELARSNADLEQFAYVASHDLQEPLRKISSFCQLLEQRYKGQLDDRADQYIEFVVSGARRMQALISDLLTFSRVGRTSEGFAAVDLGPAVARAWNALETRAVESDARLDVHLDEPARIVHGDASLLHILLTNLLGNAIKYRRPELAPVVDVTSRVVETEAGAMAQVDVADNGIGIPAEYAEKVFVIFQRLHGRDEYEGTGIGLALAKRVVEFHGGSIGVGASSAGGTTITFTLPLEEQPSHV